MPGLGLGLSPCLKRGKKKIAFPATLTDGTEIWRLIADTDEFWNWQHTLTTTGFSGTEDIDFYTPEDIV